MTTAEEHEVKRLAAHKELAQAALEWYELSDGLCEWSEERGRRESRAHGRLREVILRNWLFLH